jgi:hypothetical protein
MKTFDIFSGNPKNGSIWQCAVEGEAEAVFIMKQLADEKPGPYFVYDTQNAKVLAVVTGPRPKPGTHTRRKRKAA